METVPVSKPIALKNILFLTDFSGPSAMALPYAAMIARAYGAKVTALHIVAPSAYTYMTSDMSATLLDAQEDAAKTEMRRVEAEFAGLPRETMIERNVAVWPALSKILQKGEIDLIVLGTHGRTGIGRILLGSVAEEILRKAPCPVLTVGPHVMTDPDQAAAMKEILYATELATDAPATAPYAISLAQENQARLALLYVIDTRKTPEVAIPTELANTKLHKLQKLVSEEAELWCEPRYIVEQGIPAEKILQSANALGADLIVLGAQPATWMITHLNAGTVHKVVAGAKCPVLTVHSGGPTKRT